MRLLRRPLPEVLREAIMDPIGASDTWEWRGYRNSTIEIDGKPMESVSGGGHWGGGLFISSRDHARIGQLMLRRGSWNGRQLISERWLRELATPSATNPGYGFLWWLNTGRKLVPSAPESSIFALGGGQNAIWVDETHDLVAGRALAAARAFRRRDCAHRRQFALSRRAGRHQARMSRLSSRSLS